jgi:hypothetical protein
MYQGVAMRSFATLLLTILSTTVVISSVAISSGTAQICLEYQNYIHWDDAANFGIWGESVLLQGDLAYCLVGGLEILDISDPAEPVELSYMDLSGHPDMAVIDGDLLYLACSNVNNTGFTIVDVSDPHTPYPVSTTSTSADAISVHDIPGQGKVVCIGYRSGTTNYLKIYGVDDPLSPGLQSYVPLPGASSGIRRLAHFGKLLYICHMYPMAGQDDILIYDISDPSSPTQVGGVNIADNSGVHDIEIAGDQLYLANRLNNNDGQLLAYSLSAPHSPVFTGSVNTSGGPFGLGVTGSVACMHSYKTLSIIDISDPVNPILAGNLRSPFDMLGMDADGGRVVAVGEGFEMSGMGISPWLLTADLSSGQFVTPVAHLDLAGVTSEMVVQGDLAYMLVSGSGLEIYDLTSPLSPQLLVTLPLDLGYTTDIRVEGERAFVMGVGGDITVVDINDPHAPLVLGAYDTTGNAKCLAVSGDLVWLGISEWDDMWWEYRYHYVCVDLGDPGAPVELYSSPSSGYWIEGLEISGDHLCIAGGSSQDLRIMDVSDPVFPVLVGSLGLSGSPQAVYLEGEMLFMAGGHNTSVPQNKINIIDLSDLTSPVLMSEITTQSAVRNFAFDGQALYAASTGNGLEVFDLLDPENPGHVGCYSPAGRGYHTALWGNYLGLSVATGIDILPRHCDPTGVQAPPAGTVRLSNHPNPFNPATMISFSLETGGEVRLTVHDIGGRLLRVLVESSLAAGEQRITWDGADHRGNRMPSGIYLVRLVENGIATGNGKLTLLK